MYNFFPNKTLVGFDPLWIVAGLLFIPYLVWGVYLLRQQLDDHIEIRPAVKVLTLVGVIFFFALQYMLLKVWLGPTPWKLILAVLGLLISAVALYGHLLISLGSYLLTDLILPSGGLDMREPRYGGAEARERVGDFEGALREYLTIARMFPKDPVSVLRAGDNLVKLDRPEEAVKCFERGLALLHSAEKSLPVVNRVVELYMRELHRPDKAIEVLDAFVEKYPDFERVESIRLRIAQIQKTEGDVTDSDPFPPVVPSE